MPEPECGSLHQKCAQIFVTNIWSGSYQTTFLAYSKEMGDTEMALVFKIEVATYLKRQSLAKFIQAEGWLTRLAQCAWPDQFQRHIINIYQELSWLDLPEKNWTSADPVLGNISMGSGKPTSH